MFAFLHLIDICVNRHVEFVKLTAGDELSSITHITGARVNLMKRIAAIIPDLRKAYIFTTLHEHRVETTIISETNLVFERSYDKFNGK